MPNYSLIFNFEETVFGNQFLAQVKAKGRVLMTQENDQWWLYGVRPGSIAEYGNSPQEAFYNFKETFKGVLFDIASESADYRKFEDSVKQFFSEKDAEEEKRWIQAREDYKKGAIKPPEPICNLKKESSDSSLDDIKIELIKPEKYNTERNPKGDISVSYSKAA